MQFLLTALFLVLWVSLLDLAVAEVTEVVEGPYVPAPRTGHAAVLVDSIIYIYGGTTTLNTTTPTNDLIFLSIGSAFNVSSPPWSNSSSPQPSGPTVSGHTLSVGGQDRATLVVFGGQLNGSGQLYEFSTLSGAWNSGINSKGMSERTQHTVVTNLTSITTWLFGGMGTNSTTALGDIWALNTISSSPIWTPLAAPSGTVLPNRRAHTSSLIIGGKMVVIGGFDASSSNVTSPVQMGSILYYDTIASAWQTMNTTGSAPTPRILHSAVTIAGGTKIVIFGGDSTTGTMLGDLWVLDMSVNPPAWSSPSSASSDAPPGRSGHTAVMAGTHMIVMFGQVAEGLSNDVFALNTANFTWVTQYQPINLASTWPYNISHNSATHTQNSSASSTGTPLAINSTASAPNVALIGGVAGVGGAAAIAILILCLRARNRRRGHSGTLPAFFRDSNKRNQSDTGYSPHTKLNPFALSDSASSAHHSELTFNNNPPKSPEKSKRKTSTSDGWSIFSFGRNNSKYTNIDVEDEKFQHPPPPTHLTAPRAISTAPIDIHMDPSSLSPTTGPISFPRAIPTVPPEFSSQSSPIEPFKGKRAIPTSPPPDLPDTIELPGQKEGVIRTFSTTRPLDMPRDPFSGGSSKSSSPFPSRRSSDSKSIFSIALGRRPSGPLTSIERGKKLKEVTEEDNDPEKKVAVEDSAMSVKSGSISLLSGPVSNFGGSEGATTEAESTGPGGKENEEEKMLRDSWGLEKWGVYS